MRIPRVTVYAQGETGEAPPLMIRYILWESDRVAIWIHHHLREDPGPFHDHPWNYWSLVLWGCHTEQRPVDPPDPPLRRDWLSLRWHAGEWIHRISANDCWTLVIRGRKYREHRYYPA